MALLRNQAQALLLHERIRTTVPKAKELRPFVERLISVAKRGLVDGADGNRALHARRIVARDLADRDVTRKLFDTIAPRFASRPGGYTRLLRVGFRRGDSAEVAQVELVGSEYIVDSKGEPEASTADVSSGKGVGGRLRNAAKRIRAGASSSDSDSDSGKA